MPESIQELKVRIHQEVADEYLAKPLVLRQESIGGLYDMLGQLKGSMYAFERELERRINKALGKRDDHIQPYPGDKAISREHILRNLDGYGWHYIGEEGTYPQLIAQKWPEIGDYGTAYQQAEYAVEVEKLKELEAHWAVLRLARIHRQQEHHDTH